MVESHSAGSRLEATPSIVVPAHGRETTRGGSSSPLCAMTIDHTPPPPPPLTALLHPRSPALPTSFRPPPRSVARTRRFQKHAFKHIQTHIHSNTFKHRHEAVDCVATAPVTAAQCNCKPRQAEPREDLTLYAHITLTINAEQLFCSPLRHRWVFLSKNYSRKKKNDRPAGQRAPDYFSGGSVAGAGAVITAAVDSRPATAVASLASRLVT